MINVSCLANGPLRRITGCSQWAIPHGPSTYIFCLWSGAKNKHFTNQILLLLLSILSKLAICIWMQLDLHQLYVTISFPLIKNFFKVNFFLHPISPQACFKKWTVLTVNSISHCLFLPRYTIMIKLSLHLSVTPWIFFTSHVPDVQCLYPMPTDLPFTLLCFLACLSQITRLVCPLDICHSKMLYAYRTCIPWRSGQGDNKSYMESIVKLC